MPSLITGSFRSLAWYAPPVFLWLIGSVVYTLHFPYLEYWDDTPDYVAPAVALFRGGEFNITTYRSHGGASFYYLLLEACQGSWFAVLVVQKLMLLAVPTALAFWLSRIWATSQSNVSGEQASRVTKIVWWVLALAIFCHPSAHVYAHTAGIEMPAAFFLALALAIFAAAMRVKSRTVAMLIKFGFAPAVFFCAVTMRPQIIGLLPLTFLNGERRWLRFVPAAAVIGWIAAYGTYNLTARGFWGIAKAGGINGLSHAIPLALSYEYDEAEPSVLFPDRSPARQVSYMILNKHSDADATSAFPATHLWRIDGVLADAQAYLGLTRDELDDVLNEVRLKLSLAQPLASLRLILKETGNFFWRDRNGFAQYFSPLRAYDIARARLLPCEFPTHTPDVDDKICSGRYSSPFPQEWALRGKLFLSQFQSIWNLVLVASFVVVFPLIGLSTRGKLRRQPQQAHMPFSELIGAAILGCAVVTATVSWADARFRFPAEPIMVAYLAAAVAVIATRKRDPAPSAHRSRPR